jgi:iron complex transport system substrate-binding protein
MIYPVKNRILWVIFFLGVLFDSCNPKEYSQDKSGIVSSTSVMLDYAKRFEIIKSGNVTLVVIKLTEAGSNGSLTYALIPSGTDPPENLAVDQVIEVPVKRMVVTSTSHIPFLDLLGSSDCLVGFPNTDYISSELMRSRIEQNLIKDVGSVNGLDFESLIELQPELVVSYISGPDRGELDLLSHSGIPVVINLDFMEDSPLGRAEWIKFMGLMVGKFNLADSVFREIEQKYQQLMTLTESAADKPPVFSGILYGDTWFAPGGNSFVARFIEDAGGYYTWGDQKIAGSVELSFEAVLDRNVKTNFWIGAGGFLSKHAIEDSDPRYANFHAFKTGDIYNYHGRIGATGGFEYLELGGARPDLVLADFMKILHPELLPNYQFYFFKKLH